MLFGLVIFFYTWYGFHPTFKHDSSSSEKTYGPTDPNVPSLLFILIPIIFNRAKFMNLATLFFTSLIIPWQKSRPNCFPTGPFNYAYEVVAWEVFNELTISSLAIASVIAIHKDIIWGEHPDITAFTATL